MKLWVKMVLWSLALFIVIFNISGIAIIESSHSAELRGELSRVLEQQQTLSSAIGVLLQNKVPYTEGLELQILRSYVASYTINAMPSGSYLEVLRQDHSILFRNYPGQLSSNRPEIKNIKPGLQNYIIRNCGDRTYLFASSVLTLNGEDICVSYIKDINGIYEKRQQQYISFIVIDLLTCLLFGIGIYLISRKITRPLEELAQSAQQIAEGTYTQGVICDQNDEIGILARSFKRMADIIQQKIEELNESARQKQQFIDNFTHELRTPLTSIIGYSELLKKQDLTPEYYKISLDNIHLAGKRIQHLSDAMLKLAQLRPENLILERITAQQLFAQAGQAFTVRLKEQRVKLIVEPDDYIFYGDSDLCVILIGNLLENSLKASPENSNITLGVFRQSGQIGIFVSDEGTGIPRESLARLFEPFYTADEARSGPNGLGLGLTICLQIAMLHGWKIEVESKTGQGTDIKIVMQNQDTSILQLQQDFDIDIG